MRRLLPVVLTLLLAQSPPAHAASENAECAPPVLAALARALKVAHFVPAPSDDGQDAAGVVLASSCKRMPDDPHLTLAAVAWDAQKEDSKALVIAVLDAATLAVVASRVDEIDEDASVQVDNGSLRLDTAPYELAPGVRAFGLDIFSDERSCGEGTLGPTRALYVREGSTLRPVLEQLYISQSWYLRGNQPRCVSNQKEAETAVIESYDVKIALGAAGKGGWRDLVLTATAKRDDHKTSTRKPLHVRIPCDGGTYSLVAFQKAYDQWRK